MADGLKRPPPDRDWIEFETRRDLGAAAIYWAPLMFSVILLALLLVLS